MRKIESVRMATPLAASCWPSALCINTWPSRATSITAPGMRPRSTSARTVGSMRSSRAASRPPRPVCVWVWAAHPASAAMMTSRNAEAGFTELPPRNGPGNSSLAPVSWAPPVNLSRDNHPEIRDAVRTLCVQFDSAYWQKIDEQRAYPEAFVEALTKAGWMSALIPEEFGGSGLSLTEATVIMEEVTRSGGNAGCCHGQMYNMNTLLRHGSAQQKQKYLPQIATGKLRLQAMGVTEPGAGTDTTKIKTTAVKKGDRYVVNGQKVWTSRLQHSEVMILLARTAPPSQKK